VFREWTSLPPERDTDAVQFGEVGRFDLRVVRDGSLYFRNAFPILSGSPLDTPLEFRDVAARAVDFLETGAAILANVAGYTGDLYVAASLVNLGERPIQASGAGWSPTSQPRRRVSKRVGRWTFDEVDFRTGGDPLKAAKEIFASLYWETTYQGYEKFLDEWETHTRRRRNPA
jgi:hypothetical protein